MVSRNSWLVLLGCCLIPLLSFPRALVSDRTLFVRDVTTVWSPQVEAVVRQVARGEAPFFDARRGFGQPLFADPRAEVLYPLSWLHWFLPADRSYSLFCAIHLVIAALGAARLARRLCPQAGLAGELTAGLAFGASGPLLSLVPHWHHLAAVAWMPWIVLKCDPEPGAKTPWLSLSTLVALQILAGSPDYSLTTFLLCFLRLITRSDRPARDRLNIAVCLGLGVLLSAVQTLPSFSFARDAARDPFPIGWALSPLHPALTLETLLPVRAETWPLTPQALTTLFGGMQVWMFSHYLGLSVWVLSGLGLSRMPSRDRRFALSAVFMGLVMSFGVRDESLQEIVARIPLLSGLRFPTKHLAATSLGLALLASRGVSSPATPDKRTQRAILFSMLTLLAALIGVHAWATGALDMPPAVINQVLLPLALVALVTVGVSAFPRSAGRWLQLAPLIAGIDLLGTQTHLNPTTPSALFRDRPPLSAVLLPGARLYVSDYSISISKRSAGTIASTPSDSTRAPSIRRPGGVPYGLRQIPIGFSPPEALVLAATWYLNPPIAGRFGYFGSFDMDILDFYRAPLKRVVEEFATSRDPAFLLDRLRRASVDNVITMDAPELWNLLPLVTEEQRFFANPVRVYRVPDPWPRVRYETPGGELDPDAGAPKILQMTDGHMVFQTSRDRATKLVVAASFDRGWRARVDGVESAVEENGLAFLSVPLRPGTHRVEIAYRPPLLAAGIATSLVALGAVLGLTLGRRSKTSS